MDEPLGTKLGVSRPVESESLVLAVPGLTISCANDDGEVCSAAANMIEVALLQRTTSAEEEISFLRRAGYQFKMTYVHQAPPHRSVLDCSHSAGNSKHWQMHFSIK